MPTLPTFRSSLLRTLLSALLVTQPVTCMWADAPVGTVVSGEASFDYNGNKTTITAGNNAIIEYPKFNIDRNETVQFVQPTDTSRVLNRITGGDPTSILGNLQANGIVYFVNPAGIYFGQHATIDVGQFYAAAGNLSNSNFLAGRDNFERLSGQVHNEGTINASAIHLIGQNVRNTGNLNSPAGLVMLAAGEDVLIGRRGEHVFVNATANSHPDTVKVGVENTGNINAQGGRALLAAGDLYALAVQNSGVIKARNVELAGQGSGEVWNRGAIDASSSDADSTGGRVEITGQYVGLSSESTIDASGASGGGEVLIGGDYQGANTDIRNATATYVAEGATIRADATTSGSGGRVIVWADETTRFHGNISATGFTSGGFAEVSGKQNLLYAGLADLRSANGLTGTLLLDPDNITISNTTTTVPSSGLGGDPFAYYTYEPPGDGEYYLGIADLVAQLATAHVTVKTNTGRITLSDTLSYNTPTNLTLQAANSLYLNAPIINAGAGGLTINAGSYFWKTEQNNAAWIDVGGDVTVRAKYAEIDFDITSRHGKIDVRTTDRTEWSGTRTLLAGSDIHLSAGGTIEMNELRFRITSTGGNITVADDLIAASVGPGGLDTANRLYLFDATASSGTIQVGAIQAGAGILNIAAPDGRRFFSGTISIAAKDIVIGKGLHALENNYPENNGGVVTLTASNAIRLTNANAYLTAQGTVDTTGNINAAGNLNIAADTEILIRSGNITTGGNLDFRDATGGVTLNASSTFNVGGNYTSSRRLQGAYNVSITASNITQTAAIVADQGSLTLVADDEDGIITLGGATSAGAQTYRAVTLTGTGLLKTTLPGGNINLDVADIVFRGAGAVDSAGAITSYPGSFRTETAANTLTAVGNIHIGADGMGVFLAGDVTSTAGSITLAAENNMLINGDLSAGTTVYIENVHDDLILNNVTSSGSQTYNVSVLTLAGTLSTTSTATGDIIIKSIDEIRLKNGGVLNSARNISAGMVESFVSEASSNTITANGNINISAANDITLAGGVTSVAGDISLASTTGNITFVNATSPNGTQTYTAGRDISYTGTLNARGVSFNAGRTLTLGALISGTHISLTSGSLIITDLLQTTNPAAGDITLITTSGGILVTDDGRIDAAAKFSATSNGNFTTSNAANTITAAGDIAITTTSLNAGIVLNGDLASTAGNIALVSSNSIASTAGITATGAFSATAATDMTLRNVTTGGAQNYSATNFTAAGLLKTTGANGDISIKTINGQTVIASGGGIDATGSVAIQATSFASVASGSISTGKSASIITISDANIGGSLTAADSIRITSEGGDLLISGDVLASAGRIDVAVNSYGGSIHTGNVTSGSGQSYKLASMTGGGNFTGTGLLKTTGIGADIAINSPRGNITLNGNGAIDATGAVNLDATFANSRVTTETAANTITAGSDIVIAAGAGITINGNLTAATGGAGAITLTSNNGGISLLNVTATSNGNQTYTAAGSILLTGILDAGTGSIIANAGGDLTLPTIIADNSLSFTGSNIYITGTLETTNPANGDITLVGTGTTIMVHTATTNGLIEAKGAFTSTAAAFLSENAANTIAAGGDISVTTDRYLEHLVLNGAVSSATGSVRLESESNIIANAPITADVSGTHGVDFRTGDGGRIIIGDISTGGAQTYYANMGFTGTGLLQTNSAATGNISIISINDFLLNDGGRIDAAGNIDANAQFNFTTADAANTIKAAGDISIGSGSGDIVIGGTLASTTGNLSINSSQGNITLNSPVSATSVILRASLGAITAGDITTTGTQSHTAATFTGTGLLQTTATGDIVINTTGAATITGDYGSVDSAAAFTVISGAFVSNSAANTITAAGPVSIEAASSTIALNGALTSGSTISLTAQNGITSGSFATITAAGSITMRNANAHIILNGEMESAAGGIDLQSRDHVFLRGNVKSGVTGTDGIFISSSVASIETNSVLTGGAQTYVINGNNGWYFRANGALTSLDAATGDITIIARPSESTTFSGSSKVNAAGKFTYTTGGAFTTAGAANTITAGGLITISSTSIALNGAVFNDAGINLTADGGYIATTAQITATTGNVIMNAGAGAITTAGVLSGGTQSYTAGSHTASGQLRTTGAATGDIIISTTGATLLTGDGQIDAARAFTADAREFTTAASANTITAGTDIAITAGGDITLNGNLTAASAGGPGAITLTSNAGDIALLAITATSNGNQTYTAAGSILLTDILDAGSGSIIANAGGDLTLATIIADNSLSFTGSNIYITGTLETTNPANGDITLVGTGTTIMVHTATTNGLIDAAGAFTSTSAAFLSENAANTIAAGGDISVTTDRYLEHLVLNGAVSSATGGITLMSESDIIANAPITADVSGTRGVDFITGGRIIVGDITTGGFQSYSPQAGFTGTGLIKTNDSATGGMWLYTTGDFLLTDGGRIDVAGRLEINGRSGVVTTGADNTIKAAGDTRISSDSTITLGGTIAITDGSLTILTNYGGITLNSSVSATSAILHAYSSGITINGDIRSTAGSLLTDSYGNTIINANVTTSGSQVYETMHGIGGITITGTLTTETGNDGDIRLLSHSDALLTGNALINADGAVYVDTLTLTTANAANTITAGDFISVHVTAATGDAITLNGALTALNDNINLNTLGGNITANAQLTATTSVVTLDAVTGAITVGGVLSGGTQSYTGGSFTGTGLLRSTYASAGDIVINTTGAALLTGNEGRIDSAATFTSTSATFLAENAANTITAAGAVDIRATNDLTLNGALASSAGGVNLASQDGIITLTALLTSNTAGTDGLVVTTNTVNPGSMITISGEIITGGAQTYTGYHTNVSGTLKTLANGSAITLSNEAGFARILGQGLVETAGDFLVTAGGFTADAGTRVNATGDIDIAHTYATTEETRLDGLFTSTGSQKYTSESQAGIVIGGTLNTTSGDIILNATQAVALVHTATTNGLIDSAGKLTAAADSFTTATADNTISAVSDITIETNNNIALGGTLASTAGVLALTSTTGNITLDSPASGTSAFITAAAGAITVGDFTTTGIQHHTAATFTGTGALTTTDSVDGNIVIQTTDAILLTGDGIVDAANSLYAEAGSFTTDAAANTLATGSSVIINTTDAITLNGALTADIGNVGLLSNNGDITINASVHSGTAAGGTGLVHVESGGALTMGEVISNGTQEHITATTITGTGLLQTLDTSADILMTAGGAILLTGDDARIDSAAKLTSTADSFTTAAVANTITATGDITIATLNDIALNGNLTTASALTLNSDAGNIALTDINAHSNGDQTYTAAGDILLSSTLNAGSGGITADAGGALTLVNATGSSAIALTGSQITLTGLLSTANAADGAITLTATGAGITLADSGAINSADTLSATANGTFLTTAAANTLTAANNIDITIAQDGLAAKGDILLNGALTSTAGSITLDAHERDITATAQISADTTGTGGITATAGWGSITLAGVLTGGAQNYSAGGFTGTGHLQTNNATHGNININVLGGILITEADGQIIAANSLNATTSLGGFTTSSAANTITAGNAVTIDTVGDIELHGAATAVNDIKLTSADGNILSTAQLTSSASGLAATAASGIITIGNAQTSGTQTYTAITLTGTGLIKTTAATTGDIVINVTDSALLTGLGAIDSARTLVASAGNNVTTDAANNTINAASDITIATNNGHIHLGGTLASANGVLTLTSTLGNITLDSPATGTSAVLTANSGTITLGNITTNGSQTYTSLALTGTGLIKTNNAATGDVLIDVTDAVLLTAQGAIDAASVITATAGSITADSAANTLTAAKNINLTAANDITLAGNLASATGDVLINTTDGGSIILTNLVTTPAGEIALTTTGTGAITLLNATSSGAQTHTTEGGNINVTGTLAIGNGATMTFSTTSATTTGTTIVDAGAALVVPNTTLLVKGGMFLAETGRISAPTGIDIQGAGAGVTFNAALGGAGNPLATINIAGAGAIDINGGIETSGVQTYNTDGGDINITSLLRATNSGAAITFDTHNPSGTTGMTTVHTGGIETNNATVTSTGGLTLAADTTFNANGGSLYIDGQGRAASIGIDLALPQVTILNAGDIHLSGVTTTGNQYYHFDDGAAMRLSGTLLATGNNSSITIENTRTDHADWATIFAVGGNGIHIETLNGNITISKYNTLLSYDPDNGAASPTAGDIYIRAWNGLATVPDISASHQVDLIARAITLSGTLYQSGGINILGMDGAPINSALFTLVEPSVAIVTIKNHALYPPLVGITSHAYLPAFYDETTHRVTTDFFRTVDGIPEGSIFGELYAGNFSSWMYLFTELVQINIAANTFDKSLELSAVEENMRKATAGFLASNDAANRITGATKESLYNVGIFARGATDSERLSQHYYRGTFQQIIASEIPSPENRQVVDGRISETSAREAVALYQETFMTVGDDGRPVSRTSEILAALTATYNAYRATTAAPGPVGFGLYIDDNAATNTDAAVSQKFVRSLRTLFAAIERIGLTRTEVAVAKSVLLRPLRSPAIPGATLRGLIEPDTMLANTPSPEAPKITANY